jgi:hypothetical protein
MEQVAVRFGVNVSEYNGRYRVFSHPASAISLTVPASGALRAIYVRQFVQLIEEIGEVP